MRENARTTLLLIAALAAVIVLAGCGGGGDSSSDPQQVLDNALGGGQSVESGVLDLSLDVESTGDQPGTLTASVQGPFRSNGSGTLPSLDFGVKAGIDSGATSLDFDGGLTISGDGAYIGFSGQEYQLDDASFKALKASYEASAKQQDSSGSQGSLQQFGVDPASWVTDLTNDGTEDLDGTEVVHVSGGVDVPKMFADLNDIAQQTGQADQINRAALNGLKDTVTDASIDVYAASDDESLRQLDLSVTLADPRGGSGEVTVKLSVGISDPGSDQEISAPSDATPIADLLRQIPGGVEALGLGGGASGGTGTAGSSPGTTSRAAKKYYDCVAKAKNAAAVDACAAQLGG